MNNTFILNIIKITSIIIASSIHEYAHASIADKLGDDTPRINNRLTLNPFAHIDPIGAISLWFFNFGWSKPVPINPKNFNNSAIGTTIVSLAGPLSNIITAISTAIFIKIFPFTSIYLYYFIFINCTLALFNLIPLAPLDGFKIVSGLLPLNLRIKWNKLEKYGPIILILSIIPYSPIYSLFTLYMGQGLQILTDLLIF